MNWKSLLNKRKVEVVYLCVLIDNTALFYGGLILWNDKTLPSALFFYKFLIDSTKEHLFPFGD